MKQSPLDRYHRDAGARMVDFAGWEMPIQYQGIVAEHLAVRQSVGLFDISHMGQFVVSGPGAGDWLNGLLTNDTRRVGPGQGQYTLMLDETGGVIDDMIIYAKDVDHFFLVVNAARIDEDFAWMNERIETGISLENQSELYGGLAIQGPGSAELWEKMQPGSPLPERNGILYHGDTIICRTGYTGEDGFEFFAPASDIGGWFERFVKAGAVLCGLGARDTLRLEKCYPLNGNDLDREHTPLQAGLGMFVKLKTDIDFIGRDILEQQKSEGLNKKLCAIRMTGKAPPPRHGYEVIDTASGQNVAQLSSGTISPSLGYGIGMAYLPVELSTPGSPVEIGIRQKRFPAEVVKKPFV